MSTASATILSSFPKSTSSVSLRVQDYEDKLASSNQSPASPVRATPVITSLPSLAASSTNSTMSVPEVLPISAPEAAVETTVPAASAAATTSSVPTPLPTADAPITKIIHNLSSLSLREQEVIRLNLERLGTYPSQLPLSSSWTLYFSGKGGNNGPNGEWVDSHIPIFTVDSVPSLCGSLKAYKTLSRSKKARTQDPDTMLSNLRAGQNLHFFVAGITPSWEAVENERGGRVTISPSGNQFDLIYERLILLLAGSSLESATSDLMKKAESTGVEGYICGVVASKRPRGDRIELWLGARDFSAAPGQAWLECLKEALSVELEMPELKTTKYKRHL